MMDPTASTIIEKRNSTSAKEIVLVVHHQSDCPRSVVLSHGMDEGE